MSKYIINNEIDKRINIIRRKMINSGLKNGFSHPDTVKLSQELDRIINELQCSERYN
ncbi:aspartyl-phosphate phosphatase Spo0E family protein [Bacillus dakarensis]|uniref:aspartyl-phosphate phosphatase Spo0E family protein n=1 Tax=Robertmurraya dakarensis TaxID=1926278 RepID=UPI0009FF90C8|nr:aspartyl-phosphate phosphatase Spo0E family protein [Bacillus dakarensis]